MLLKLQQCDIRREMNTCVCILVLVDAFSNLDIYEDSNDNIEQTSCGKSQREGLPAVYGKARYKLFGLSCCYGIN